MEVLKRWYTYLFLICSLWTSASELISLDDILNLLSQPTIYIIEMGKMPVELLRFQVLFLTAKDGDPKMAISFAFLQLEMIITYTNI